MVTEKHHYDIHLDVIYYTSNGYIKDLWNKISSTLLLLCSVKSIGKEIN